MTATGSASAPQEQVTDKGLKSGALGLISTTFTPFPISILVASFWSISDSFLYENFWLFQL